MTHAEFVQRLRNAADFFGTREEMGVPSFPLDLDFCFAGQVNGKSVDSKEGLAEFARIVGGHIEKNADESFYTLVADREGFRVRALAYRSQVCERIQVGTKIEPEHILPAQEQQIVPEREVPIYEYRCPTILAPEEDHPLPHPMGVEA